MAAFIELSSDEVIDPDSAVNALEQLASDLNEASSGEIEYLKSAIRQEIVESGDERTFEQQDRIQFFLNFMDSIGLSEEK